jgi:hypothetical protein
MMGRQHALSADATWLAGVVVVPWDMPMELTVLGLALSHVAAYGPDADSKSSAASKAMGPLRRLLPVMTHRGRMHWLQTGGYAGVVCAGIGGVVCLLAGGSVDLALAVAAMAGLAVAQGWCVAILGDACTVQGVAMLGPWSDKVVKLPRLSWSTPHVTRTGRVKQRRHYLGTFRAGRGFERRVVAQGLPVIVAFLAVTVLAKTS